MDPKPVKIYSAKNVSRLRYISGVILGDILGLSWEVITDKRKLGKNHVINYSDEIIPGSLKIKPDRLLFEKGFTLQKISVDQWKGLPVFFQTDSDSDLPFDIFAASFFLISRYEEYIEFQPDKHGRFPASESVAFKNGFLGIPVIDLWAKEMAKVFLKKFPTLTFKRNDYKALLTIDSDQPFAYLGKGLLRSIGGMIRDIKGNTGNAGDRYRILAKGEKDPFEVFDYIIDEIEKKNSDVRFFFPVGDYSDYDKNPSWKNEEYRKLIHRIADKFESGIHPSYYACRNSSLVNTETGRLRTILGKEIFLSRFHFIRLSLPQSYFDILEAGITEDYSMGYPEEPGFRAGIARPFYFYNFRDEQQTNLKIIPFQVMDVTLYNYKQYDQFISQDVILKLIHETKNVGGVFVSIWHNTSLINNQQWKCWRDVFEFMLKNQQK